MFCYKSVNNSRTKKDKYQKLLEIETEIVREVALGDKHPLRKSADRKAQFSPVSGMNAFLICAFRSADFLRWCLSPQRNLRHNLFIYFQ